MTVDRKWFIKVNKLKQREEQDVKDFKALSRRNFSFYYPKDSFEADYLEDPEVSELLPCYGGRTT